MFTKLENLAGEDKAKPASWRLETLGDKSGGSKAIPLSYRGMRRTLFITATGTDAGKTVLAALLLQLLREKGVSAAAFKPVCSGGRADARILRAVSGGALTLDEINPWYFRAAIAPALAAKQEGKTVCRAQVLAHLRANQKNFAVTLVEGAGGLLSPLGADFNSRDLILSLRAAPVILAPNRLGVINDLLLTLEALPKQLRAKTKIVLMSPAKPDAATRGNAGLLGEFFPAERIFTLPWLGNNFRLETVFKKPEVRCVLENLISG
jgi:dethiobiotin synthetase